MRPLSLPLAPTQPPTHALAPSRRALSAPHDMWLLPLLRDLLPEAIANAMLSANPPSLWQYVTTRGALTDEQIVAALSARSGAPVAACLTSTPAARDAIPEQIARRCNVLPLSISESYLDVATAHPYDLDAEQLLAFTARRTIRFVLATPPAITQGLDALYAPHRYLTTLVQTLSSRRSPSEYPPVTHESISPDDGAPIDFNDSPIVTLVDRMVTDALAARASDIHVEMDEEGVAVRYRIDGVIRLATRLPKLLGPPLVSRVKIMARLDIADRLRPQGGRARISVASRPIDLRISTLPAALGEKVVIRILDPETTLRSLDSLGFTTDARQRLNALLECHEGLALITGPTGSGKTTTLYAALHVLVQRGLNVVTVEDPVEYRVPGIVQVQVNEKAGLTFATALRTILRQDPDVILVGEIRDHETATIAIQAALTGHLVFATLHTIDACSAITRLHDLGVAPAKVSAAVRALVAQRLLRTPCPECVEMTEQFVPTRLWDQIPAGATLPTAKGCAHCRESGYVGRVAATEVVLTGEELQLLIANATPARVLAAAARRFGARSLWQSGVTHLLAGRTTLQELTRVLEPDEELAFPSHEESPEPLNDGEHYYDDDQEELAPDTHTPAHAASPMTTIQARIVDVYLIDPATPWRVLVLQRAPHSRCPGAWEAVHGKIEPDETPEQAAEREVKEETGLTVQRLYNVMAHAFYLHQSSSVEIAIAFCAFVDSTQPVSLGKEFSAYEWLSVPDALARFFWPRAVQVMGEIQKLLGQGHAGPAEDVLRVK